MMADLLYAYARTWRVGAPMLLAPALVLLAAMILHVFA